MTTDEMIAEIHTAVVKKNSPSDAVTLAAARVCDVLYSDDGWHALKAAIGELVDALTKAGYKFTNPRIQ